MITVVKCTTLVTLQDNGRFGYRHLGVSQAGALDALSLSLANALVGNRSDEAALEIFLGGVTLSFEQDTSIALTGSECFASLSSPSQTKATQSLFIGKAYSVKKGDTLTINRNRSGLCIYLAVAGGMDVPIVMGSKSSDVQSRLGAAALRSQDQIRLSEHSEVQKQSDHPAIKLPHFNNEISMMVGPEFERLNLSSQTRFFNDEFTISAKSNRMGFRLEGASLSKSEAVELLSHAVFPGMIQLPNDGQPIILGPECQTTGGYPRIGAVIEADLWKLGHLRPGAKVRFKRVTLAQAKKEQQQNTLYLDRVQEVLQA
ncbi:biotin-dependent carboxyltransferase family protein [Vibrio sp.]|nr:biotin-dependent carboxyltransferase family protein [Vibrio sp.]